jgi:hypothetical protein
MATNVRIKSIILQPDVPLDVVVVVVLVTIGFSIVKVLLN